MVIITGFARLPTNYFMHLKLLSCFLCLVETSEVTISKAVIDFFLEQYLAVALYLLELSQDGMD